MFCKYCGKELKDGSKYCVYCGKKLTEERTERLEKLENTGKEPVNQKSESKPPEKKGFWKKAAIGVTAVGVLGVFALLIFNGVICFHEWSDATCTSPKTCAVCGKTKGEAIPHDWIDATCTSPKICAVCGETEGEAIPHDWIDATCTSPKTCAVCSRTEGDPLQHELDSLGRCKVCGENIGVEFTIPEAADSAAEFILEGSDTRYLTASELSGMSKEELRLARNEIYARHGRMFSSEDLQNYFNSKEWYYGTIPADQFDEEILNEFEKENLILIKEIEAAK